MFGSNTFYTDDEDFSTQKNWQAVGKLFIFNKILLIIKDTLSHVIVLIQIFEWLTIVTLLSWQKGKSDREIAQDTIITTEDSDPVGNLANQSFMQNELLIKKVFYISCMVLSIAVLITNTLVYANAKVNAFLARWLIEVCEILAFTYIFVKLVKLAKRENRVMFFKHQNSLVLYFLGTILFLFISFISNSLPWISTVILNNDNDGVVMVPWRLNIRGVYYVCKMNKECLPTLFW